MTRSNKWLFLLALICIAMTLSAACGDDDDDDSNDSGDDDSIDDDDSSDDDDSTDDDDDSADDDDDNDTSPPGPLTIIHDFPPVAEAGQPYEYQFEAEGGAPPYSGWTAISGDLPTGMTLAPNTGLLSGTAEDEEKLYYFVIEVQDSTKEAAVAQKAFGIRVGDPGSVGPLLAKARAFQEVYDLRHNSDGLSVTADNPDSPTGDYWYTDLGDACFIHGNSSAGAAFWYAVEGTQEALDNAKLHVRGLDLLNAVNGIPGLLSRSYMPKDAPMGPNEFHAFWPDSDNHEGEGIYEDYYWAGDVSRDQYSGELIGLSWMYDLVDDPQTRATVVRNITEIADYLINNELIVYDPDGEPTQYGDFRGYWIDGVPAPNGLNAATTLAWFKLAHHATGEQRFADFYNELIDEHAYDWVLSNFMWVYMGYQTKHYNVYMAFENMFTLTRLEDDPYLHEKYSGAFERWLWESGDGLAWKRGRVEANPTFAPWYLESTGRKDPEAIKNAIWQMDMFVDAPLRDRYIENSSNPAIEKNPEFPEWALYPLPAHLKKPDMCIWHRSPYTLDGGADNGRERTGHDYLLPYWMGRYYGYIGPDW
jgi:Putative Ig domain